MTHSALLASLKRTLRLGLALAVAGLVVPGSQPAAGAALDAPWRAPGAPEVPPAPPGCTATTQVFSNPFSLDIPATFPNQLYSTLVVSTTGTFLLDADVTTNISHTNSADLDVTLTSPGNKNVTLTTDNGYTFDNVFLGTVWDD